MRIYSYIGLLTAITFIGWNAAAEAKSGAPMPHKKPSYTTVSHVAGTLPLPKPETALSPGKTETQESAKALSYNFADYDLSRPLSSRDKKIYQEIFAAQGKSDFAEADALIEKLRDTRLLGHVLEQRYRHPDYKTSFAELAAWLDHYSDHPGADTIYDFAQKRRPSGDKTSLKKPETVQGLAHLPEASAQWARVYSPNVKRSAQQRKDIHALKRDVLAQANSDHLTYALKILGNDPRTKLMTNAEKDILKSRIASGYYYLGDIPAAYRVASQSVSRSGETVPTAAWIAGLVSWREGNYKRAAKFFEITGDSPYASGWTQAAGAFWAARAHMRAGNFKAVTNWMEKAASHPRTFYGLLATRALGKDFSFNWDMPAFKTEHQNAIASFPVARAPSHWWKSGSAAWPKLNCCVWIHLQTRIYSPRF